MELRNLGADDLWIYEAQNAPEMMERLGGLRLYDSQRRACRCDTSQTW